MKKDKVSLYRPTTYFELITMLAFLGGKATFSPFPPVLVTKDKEIRLESLAQGDEWIEVAEHLKQAGFLLLRRIKSDNIFDKNYSFRLTGYVSMLLLFTVSLFKAVLKDRMKTLVGKEVDSALKC